MTSKTWLSADQFQAACWQLGLQIHDSGYVPTCVIGVWRGGCTAAIAVHELLQVLGVNATHYPIKTSLYNSPEQRRQRVEVWGVEAIARGLGAQDRVLVVDDVFDTGLTLQAVKAELVRYCRYAQTQIRVATPYYKPANNQTDTVPDFFLFETSDWLVFPHELAGLDMAELLANKPGVELLRLRLNKSV